MFVSGRNGSIHNGSISDTTNLLAVEPIPNCRWWAVRTPSPAIAGFATASLRCSDVVGVVVDGVVNVQLAIRCRIRQPGYRRFAL
jgi:hypothetical protein